MRVPRTAGEGQCFGTAPEDSGRLVAMLSCGELVSVLWGIREGLDIVAWAHWDSG